MGKVWSAKESPRITPAELQTLVCSWDQNVSQTTIKHHLYSHKLFVGLPGRGLCCQGPTNLGSYSLPNVNGTLNVSVFSGETKIEVFGNKHQT